MHRELTQGTPLGPESTEVGRWPVVTPEFGVPALREDSYIPFQKAHGGRESASERQTQGPRRCDQPRSLGWSWARVAQHSVTAVLIGENQSEIRDTEKLCEGGAETAVTRARDARSHQQQVERQEGASEGSAAAPTPSFRTSGP